MIGFSVSFGKPTAVGGINQLPKLLLVEKCNRGRKHTIVSQRAVGSDVDVLLVAEGNQVILQQQRMHFDLVHALW
jgi:hypothetical protein